MTELFAITDFNFPFKEDWISFVEKYPIYFLKGNPYIRYSISDWLMFCDELADPMLISDNNVIGISFIYGSCICFIFQSHWFCERDINIEKSLVVYYGLGNNQIILNPYERIITLKNTIYPESFLRLILSDCLYAHRTKSFKNQSVGHPLFQFDSGHVVEECNLSEKCKHLLREQNIDIIDLFRMAEKMGFLSFENVLCSEELENNFSHYANNH
jgi:hypothetical protein